MQTVCRPRCLLRFTLPLSSGATLLILIQNQQLSVVQPAEAFPVNLNPDTQPTESSPQDGEDPQQYLALARAIIADLKMRFNFSLLEVIVERLRITVDAQREAESLQRGPVQDLAECLLVRHAFGYLLEDLNEAIEVYSELLSRIPFQVKTDVSYF